MSKLFLTFFLLVSFPAFSQFDYELFENYNKGLTKEHNKKLISVIEYQQDKNQWTKTSLQQFNSLGLPTTLFQYDQKGQEIRKKEFIYDSTGQISKIESYESGKHEQSTEFKLNTFGQIILYSDYVYSSYDGEKMFLWKTIIEYNSNKTIKKIVKLEWPKEDTVEINFFDISGIKTKAIWNHEGLTTSRIEFIWNNDSTEMKEVNYDHDFKPYNTIVHKYKGKKEIEKTDPSTSPKPFYWKYDSDGRVTETNEQFFYVQYFEYNQDGNLTKKTLNVLFSDSEEKDLPKKIYFKYEYQYRN
jgi:YD repeat-containing protein